MAADNSRKSPAWHAREAAEAERLRQLREPGPAVDPSGPWAKGPPKFPLERGASVAAKRWWARIWSLPPAKLYTDADVLLVEQCCSLVDQQARSPKVNVALAGEIRLQQARLGIKPGPGGKMVAAAKEPELVASPKARAVPPFPLGVKAHSATRVWWTNVWSAATSADYTEADRVEIERMCRLRDRIWRRQVKVTEGLVDEFRGREVDLNISHNFGQSTTIDHDGVRVPSWQHPWRPTRVRATLSNKDVADRRIAEAEAEVAEEAAEHWITDDLPAITFARELRT